MFKRFKLTKIEDYFQTISDSTSGRQFERIKLSLPVSFAFGKPSTKKKLSFKQASTVDISYNGIALEILETSKANIKKLYSPKQILTIKFELVTDENVLIFTGKVVRNVTIHKKNIRKDFIGIVFEKINDNDKAALISYAHRIARNKQVKKLLSIILVLSVLISVIWGYTEMKASKKVTKQLVISEASRNKLKDEVFRLSDRKKILSADLKENEKKSQELNTRVAYLTMELKENKKTISKIDKSLKKIRKELSEKTRELDTTDYRIAKYREMYNYFKKRMYSYEMSSIDETIKINNTSDIKMFKDSTFIKAQNQMKSARYVHAIDLYKSCIKKYPKSGLVYLHIARAYYKNGEKGKSRTSFFKYINILEKDMETAE